MATMFFLRHQAAGILSQFPFTHYPSGDQIAAIAKWCVDKHGDVHPVTGKELFLHVIEVDVYGPDDVPTPDAEKAGLSVATGIAEVGEMVARGVAVVSNP